jgi:hypothetical protein
MAAKELKGIRKMAGSLASFGGEDPIPKKSTQAEVDAANKEAKRFAMARGLVSGSDTFVAKKAGDPLPKYIDSRTGKPHVPEITKPRAITVPDSVLLSDIKSDNGFYWYNDPQTGDLVEVDPLVLNLPRFRKPKDQINADILAMKAKAAIK